MDATVPVLPPGSQVLRIDERSVAVRTWHRTFRMRGGHADAAIRVLDAVDGARSLAAVARHAGVDPSIVAAIATKLRDSGVLWLRDAADGPGDIAPEDLLTIASGEERVADGTAGAVRAGEVLVVGTGRAAELLVGRLREAGDDRVRVIGSPDELSGHSAPCSGLVYAEELMTYRDALEIDRSMASKDVPWCAGWWEGSRLVVTHEVRFGRSACFECLLERQRANYVQPDVDIPLEERLRDGTMTTAGRDVRGVPTQLSALLADLLALRVRSLLSGPARSTRHNELAEFDLPTWTLRWSTVLRLPSCRHCSPGVLRLPGSMT